MSENERAMVAHAEEMTARMLLEMAISQGMSEGRTHIECLAGLIRIFETAVKIAEVQLASMEAANEQVQ